MVKNIKAWVHWVRLNPISDDQLEMADDIEKLLKANKLLVYRTGMLISQAGNPDAATACRLIIATASETLDEVKKILGEE